MVRPYLVLQGGLGNQLFQLAEALRIGTERGLVDTTLLGSRNQRTVTARTLEIGELTDLLGWRQVGLTGVPVESLYRPLVGRMSRKLEGRLFANWGLVSSAHIDAYVADSIGGDRLFRLIENWLPRDILERSGTRQSVHIRLGDYLRLEHVYGAPNEDYYREGLCLCDPAVPVSVFSDDQSNALLWFRERFPGFEFEPPPPPEHSSPGSWGQMLQMASSRVLIAGNSTYSWWATWLNARAGRGSVSVAPARMPVTNLRPPQGVHPERWN